jgi:hypothetical protein
MPEERQDLTTDKHASTDPVFQIHFIRAASTVRFCFAKRRAGNFCRPLLRVVAVRLEAETSSELSSERTRQQAAAGVDETKRVPKTRKPLSSVEVIAVIGMVRKVEGLEHELQVPGFTQLDVLRHARIHIKVRIAAQVKDGV